MGYSESCSRRSRHPTDLDFHGKGNSSKSSRLNGCLSHHQPQLTANLSRRNQPNSLSAKRRFRVHRLSAKFRFIMKAKLTASRSGSVKSTKTVKFATPPASLPSNELRGFTAPARSSTDIDPITDICTAIEGVKGDHCRVGHLTDEKTGLYSHSICLIDKQVWSEKDAKSLDCLLKLSQHQNSGYMLSRRDRLYIAFTLASSVLQLGGTSWLRENWRIGDISVLPSDAQRPEVFKLDYSHLYVSWKLLSNDPDTRLTTEAVQGPAARQIRNQYLFALGIVLIELSLKQKLSNRRLPEDFQPNEAMTDFNTATRLVNEVYDESGSRYGGVVQRCLTCPFNLRDLRNFSLDNKEFQEAVFDHILTPLRQDYEDFNGFQRIR